MLIPGRARDDRQDRKADGYAERVVGLLHDTVTVEVGDDATLRIVGAKVGIEAHPEPGYESWTLTREDGSMLVCMPGGEIAQWGPSPSA